LITARRWFGALEAVQPSRPAATGGAAAPRRFEYAPAEIIVYPGKPGFEPLRGMELQPRQDFGVELELTHPDHPVAEHEWRRVARELVRAIRDVVGVQHVAPEPSFEHNAPGKRHHWWNVERDPSCGWEISSRTLRGEEGFEEAFRVVRALDAAASRLRLRVDHRTGLHVHLGWLPPRFADVRRLMAVVAAFEPGLYSLVHPARFKSGFCRPVAAGWSTFAALAGEQAWREHFSTNGSRYLTVNPCHLFHPGEERVEVRLHHGTTAAEEVLLWTSLWMRVLHAVTRGHDADPGAIDPSRLPLSGAPTGDIVGMLLRAGAGADLLAHVRTRREKVMDASWCGHPEFAAAARAARAAWATGG
jgi:hypothetical protein